MHVPAAWVSSMIYIYIYITVASVFFINKTFSSCVPSTSHDLTHTCTNWCLQTTSGLSASQRLHNHSIMTMYCTRLDTESRRIPILLFFHAYSNQVSFIPCMHTYIDSREVWD